MKVNEPYVTTGYITKLPSNPTEKSEGVSIRNFKKCFEHFNFPVKLGEYYFILCKVDSDAIHHLKLKFNKTRGDGYIIKPQWETYIGKRFSAGTTKEISIFGIETENGLSSYCTEISIKSNNPAELLDWKIYSKKARSKQPTKDRYIKHYNLDKNNLVDYKGNIITYDEMSIDHIYPVRKAFDYNWPIEKVNDWSNLQIMKLSENTSKGCK
jgi:hypothetical protein